jgi:hypothetical protein
MSGMFDYDHDGDIDWSDADDIYWHLGFFDRAAAADRAGDAFDRWQGDPGSDLPGEG